MEGDELLDHLRVSILPWDDSILETLSPRLTTGTGGSVGGDGRRCRFP